VPASPCIGVCQLRRGTDLCEGCLRTLTEITEWGSATAERRREIVAAADKRRIEEPSAGIAAVRSEPK